MKPATVLYKRGRFTARLPETYRYSPSHYWLHQTEPGIWRIGLTKFATRMLGDMVEFEFKAAPGAAIEAGEVIGWTEGFKAISDIYSAATGEFLGSNPALAESITLIDHQPFDAGWFYEVRGVPGPGVVDVTGYIALLDATIDKMLETQGKGVPDDDC